MKRKKLIMKKRALSWILALALSGSSLALPVSAAELDDNVQVENSGEDEISDFDNDADIEITDNGQGTDDGASETVDVTEDENVEDYSDFPDGEEADTDIDAFASEEDGQIATLSGVGTEANPYMIETAADVPEEIAEGTVYAQGGDIILTEGQQISTIA